MAEKVPPSRPEEELRQSVTRKAQRRMKSAKEGNRSVWFSLGLFGLIGWSVAVPTLLGLALGVWIDSRWPSRISWTLTLLFVGVVTGCIHAWRWMRQETRDE